MDNIRNLVKDELNEVESCISNLMQTNSYEDLNHFVQNKSKCIRSVITLLYLKANHVKISNDIITLLAAIELTHNASLLHDDVVDDGMERRGEKTIYAKYGSKTSVLYGDYLLSLAMRNVLKLNNIQILDMFISTAAKMSSAELNQLSNRGNLISLNEYLKIIEGKTASLFELSLNVSALLTNLDVMIAGEFGKVFGIIFQINNDLNSKSAANDMKNGVNTAINILGIEKTLALKDNYKKELSKILLNIPESNYKNGIEDIVELL